MYINLMIHQNENINISRWLLLITFLVASMIIIGGLTRLTGSGLSITKWDLLSGILPPLTLQDWNYSFSLYKKIPEYKLINSSMTLDQFKLIYWWEYLHRLLGRIVGIFYFLPLIYFTIKKKIKGKNLFLLYTIFFLICLQGFIGWYMVQSGLSERTDVSQYRLSLHLSLAFIIFILLLWNFFLFNSKKDLNINKKLPFYLPILLIFLILLQISIGAFVSGLDAAKIYQTWPLMNQFYFPDDSNFVDLFSLKIFETPSLVQFIHRNIAYLILFFFLIIFLIVFANKKYLYLRKTTIFLSIALLVQTFLGILTVLSGAQIVLASMHQIGSIFLISYTLLLVFKNYKTN